MKLPLKPRALGARFTADFTEEVARPPAPSGGSMPEAVGAFLLSPASTSGRRAEILLRDGANFPLALRVSSSEGAPIGEVFSFLSGLYFRGKATYARAFGPAGGTFVITPDRGLVPIDARVTAGTLRAFASVDVHHQEARFTEPLLRDAAALALRLHGDLRVVLLGSIASQKYVAALGAVFGSRLLFPRDFVGRGDMSRGGLLLRAARAGVELAYESVLGAERRGKRPPRLAPVRGILREAMTRDENPGPSRRRA